MTIQYHRHLSLTAVCFQQSANLASLFLGKKKEKGITSSIHFSGHDWKNMLSEYEHFKA